MFQRAADHREVGGDGIIRCVDGEPFDNGSVLNGSDRYAKLKRKLGSRRIPFIPEHSNAMLGQLPRKELDGAFLG